MLINSALMLEGEGYEVHIFIDDASYERSEIEFGNKNILIHIIAGTQATAPNSIVGTDLTNLELVFGSQGVLRGLGLYKPKVKSCYLRVIAAFYRSVYERGDLSERLHRQTAIFFPHLFEFYEKLAADETLSSCICLLAVEQMALVAATMVAAGGPRTRRLPIGYYNMELRLEAEVDSMRTLVIKSLERSCAQLCDFVVIQDQARGAYFARDNQVPKERLIYLPVSGLGEVYRGKGDYFRKLFGIGADKRILLHAGGLVNSMCLEIAEAAHSWEDDLVFVVHCPSLAWVAEEYLDKLKRAALEKNVYLSLKPVDWEEVPELLSSANIGLLFYNVTTPNVFEIGQSSSKLAHYLQVGLPVISIDFPSLKKVLQECRCGETTHNPEDIPALAHRILRDYETYRSRAFECYTERYRISGYFDRVLKKIRQFE